MFKYFASSLSLGLIWLCIVLTLGSCGRPSPDLRPAENLLLTNKVWRIESMYLKTDSLQKKTLAGERISEYIFKPFPEDGGYFTVIRALVNGEKDTIVGLPNERRISFLEDGTYTYYFVSDTNRSLDACIVDFEGQGDWTWLNHSRPTLNINLFNNLFSLLWMNSKGEIKSLDLDPKIYQWEVQELTESYLKLEARRIVEIDQSTSNGPNKYVLEHFGQITMVRTVCKPSNNGGNPLPWKEVSPHPQPLPNNVSVSGDSYLYVGTGSDLEVGKKDFYRYDHLDDKWSRKTDFAGVGRFRAVGFSIGSAIYIGTGVLTEQGGMANDFWRYDENDESWAEISALPGEARFGAVAFSIGNKAYVGLGRGEFGQSLNDFWEYDRSTDAWQQIADFPAEGRTEAVAFVLNDIGYVGLGSEEHDDFWSYDPLQDIWQASEDFPKIGRAGAQAFAINDKAYICGGKSSGVNGIIYQDELWRFDPILETWTQKSSFPATERYFLQGGSIYSYGFVSGSDGKMWQYDPSQE